MKHITKSEGVGSFIFGSQDNTKELRGLYSDIHLGLDGQGFNFSRQDVNSNHIGRIIDNLAQTKKLATDKQQFNNIYKSDIEESENLKRYKVIKENIRQQQNKLAEATSQEERDPILQRIEEEKAKLNEFDIVAINQELKLLETSNIKYVEGRTYYKVGNLVSELNAETIQDLLMTSEVVPAAERERYRVLFGE